MVINASLYSNISTNTSSYHYTDGCFKQFNIVACTRDAIESVLALTTVIFCLVKIIKLHIAKHELWNQYLIFYTAIIEILLLTLNWLYIHQAAVDLFAELLKLLQFLVVCRFYCEVASRMSKLEKIYKTILLPALMTTLVYFVILIIVGFIRLKDNRIECIEPEWVQLSASEVILGIIFITVGVYITRQTNKLKTDGSYKRNVRISLWGIILSFELSSLVSMSYDIAMIFVGKDSDCKGVFISSVSGFTIAHILTKVLKWLLPIWAMMVIFKPDSFKGGSTEEEDSDQPPIVQRSSVGIFTSEFRPRGRSFNYKHLRDPDNDNERKLIDTTKANPGNFKSKTKRKKRRDRTKSGGSSTADSTGSNSTEGINKEDVQVSINAADT